MSNTSNQPGTYTLKTFKLWSYDLSKSIDLIRVLFNFSITESMSYGSVRGSALIVESQGIIDTFPISGQELIEVVYTDYYGIERNEVYCVYAVDGVQYGSEKQPGFLTYTLHFTSPHKFYSEDSIVQKAYTQSTISSYVKDLYSDYMQDKIPADIKNKFSSTQKLLTVEDTTNTRNLVVPKMSPEASMHFFSRNAYSSINPLNDKESSQTFRFFEARDKFFFATIEFMRSLTTSPLATGTGNALEPERGILKFYRNYSADVSPTGGSAAMQNIIDVDFGLRVNTIDNIISGGYKRRVYEFDILTMNVNDSVYDYTTQNNDESLKPVQSTEFIASHMTREKEIFLFKDYDNDDAKYSELYTRKPIYFYNQMRNTISVKIYGRNDLFAGSTVDLSFIKHTNVNDSTPTLDLERSGLYFVETAESLFEGNTYTQKLTLTRGGVTR